jgi:hypothetical protein
MKYLLFEVNNIELAIEANIVTEIISKNNLKITKNLNSEKIKGFVPLRGKILPILSFTKNTNLFFLIDSFLIGITRIIKIIDTYEIIKSPDKEIYIKDNKNIYQVLTKDTIEDKIYIINNI